MDIEKEVLQAEQRIRPYIRETSLEPSPYFAAQIGGQVYFKLENLQHTGSFKFRGAMNKLLTLSEDEQQKGCVTASTGNHGAAFAYGLQHCPHIPGLVFVPENAAQTKIAAIQRLGVEVRAYGDDGAITETYARAYAEQYGMTYISPYNDPQIIGGQGTIGIELARQLQQLDAVYVALGGGGLISGIGGYLKARNPAIEIVGCSPENSAVMAESIKAQRILEVESLPTLSDGTAGGLEPGAITFDLCQRLVDTHILVSEAEIAAAIRQFMAVHHLMIEGAAGVALAALRKDRERLAGKSVAVIICGGNISLETLKSILSD